MAGTTQTIQQGPIASRQRQLQARYNLTRHEALKDTFVKQIISDPALLDQVASVQGGFIPSPAGMSTEAAAGKLTGIGLKHVAGTEIVGPLVSKGVHAVSPSLASSLGMTPALTTTVPAAAATATTAATGAANAGIAAAYGLQSGAATALGPGFGAGVGSATGAANTGYAAAYGLGESGAALNALTGETAFGGGGGVLGGGTTPATMGMASSLAIGAAIMAAFMTVVNWGANKFDPPKKRHMEARAPKGNLNLSINTFLNEHGLNSYKTTGKGSSLGGTPAAKRSGNLSKIVRAVQEKYPGYTQMQYAEFFKRKNMDRFMPSISIDDAVEARKQEMLNPETDPGWTTPEQMKKKQGKGLMNAQWANQQLLGKAALHKEYYSQENFNYRPKELRAGKGSNLKYKFGARQTDMTMEGFFKNVYSSIEDDTFLDPFRTGTPEPEALTEDTASSMATGSSMVTGGMGSISSGSGMGASPRRSQHGMASQA